MVRKILFSYVVISIALLEVVAAAGGEALQRQQLVCFN